MFLKPKKLESNVKLETRNNSILYKWNNNAMKIGIVVLLCLSVNIASLVACDMSAFIQGDFSERCQLFIEVLDKAYTARLINHPDVEKFKSVVSREWVRFYLSHSNTHLIPPSLTFIGSDTWIAAMNKSGDYVVQLLNDGLSSEDYGKLRLQVSLMKNGTELAAIHELFANNNSNDSKDSIAVQIKDLIDKKLVVPCSRMYNLLNGYEFPVLVSALDTMVKVNIALADDLTEIAGRYSKETGKRLLNDLKKEIDQDMADWKKLFYYE